jgi:hypothetical protein
VTGGRCGNCGKESPILVHVQGYRCCPSCEALTYLPWWQRDEHPRSVPDDEPEEWQTYWCNGGDSL